MRSALDHNQKLLFNIIFLIYLYLFYLNQIKLTNISATPLSNVGTGIVHGASNSEWPSVGSGIVGGFGQYGEGSSWKSEATHGTGLGGIASKATSYVNIVSYNKAAAPGTGSNIWSGLNYGGRSYGRSNEWKSGKLITENA